MSAAPTSKARRRNPFGDEVERTMIGRSPAARCAPSMIWSDRSSSRPWHATRRTSTWRVCSVRTVSSTPSVIPTSSKFGSSGMARCTSKASSPSTATSARIRVSATVRLPGLPVSLGLVEERLHRHGQRRRLLGADLRAQEEPERPGVRGERELLRERRGCLEDVRRRLARDRRAQDLDVRREQRQERLPRRAGRRRCRRGRPARCSRRARARRRSGSRRRAPRPSGSVGTASVVATLRSAVVICWPGKMSAGRDAAVQVRRDRRSRRP